MTTRWLLHYLAHPRSSLRSVGHPDPERWIVPGRAGGAGAGARVPRLRGGAVPVAAVQVALPAARPRHTSAAAW